MLRLARRPAALAFALVTLAAWLARDPLQHAVEGRGGNVARTLASIANALGGGVPVASLGVATFVLGLLLRKQRLVDAAIVFGVAGVWCFALTNLGQLAFAEQRPIDGGAMRFFASDGHGISGHASASALLLFPIRDVLLRGARARRVSTAAVCVWIAIVGWSRVWLGMHFAWNVTAGIALGLWTGAAAVAAWNEL